MGKLPTITVRRKVHEGRICLFLFFEPEGEIARIVMDLGGCWSRTYVAWYLVEHALSIHELFVNFMGLAIVDISELEPLDCHLTKYIETAAAVFIRKVERDREDIREEKECALMDFRKYLKAQGYRSGTVRCYTYQLKRFLFSCKLPLDQITEHKILAYRDKLKRAGQTSNPNHFMRGAKIFFWHWNQRILYVDELEFHKKDRKKKMRFISHRALKAICSYTLMRDLN